MPDTDPNDERLVAQLQSDCDETFAALYDRYFDSVYRYLCMLLRSGHAAEDAAQDVFVRVYRALPGFEQRSIPLRAWIFRIARNHAIDTLRSRRWFEVTHEMGDQSPWQQTTHDDTDALDSWLPDGHVGVFVERLPIAQRQVLTLRFLLDLSTEEIGHVIGRSPASVRTLQFRALRQLRERLEAVEAVSLPVGGQPMEALAASG